MAAASDIRRTAITLKNETETYLDTFKGDGVLRLFEGEANQKKYLERYNSFSTQLAYSTGELECKIASLSCLVCEADSLCDNEMIATSKRMFDACERFLNAVSGFVRTNEGNFINIGMFRASVAFNSARELKSAAEQLENEING